MVKCTVSEYCDIAIVNDQIFSVVTGIENEANISERLTRNCHIKKRIIF